MIFSFIMREIRDKDCRSRRRRSPAPSRDTVPWFGSRNDQKKPDLLQVTAALSAELGTRPAKVMSPESLDSDLLGALLNDRPNGPVAERVPLHLPPFLPFKTERCSLPSFTPLRSPKHRCHSSPRLVPPPCGCVVPSLRGLQVPIVRPAAGWSRI